ARQAGLVFVDPAYVDALIPAVGIRIVQRAVLAIRPAVGALQAEPALDGSGRTGSPVRERPGVHEMIVVVAGAVLEDAVLLQRIDGALDEVVHRADVERLRAGVLVSGCEL